MVLGIDACNIRMGGGLTHLAEILSNATPSASGISKVILWSSDQSLRQLPDAEWLEKRSHPMLNRSFLSSFLYQLFYISRMAKRAGVTTMFVPGGTFLGSFSNVVTMSQNMLPFEPEERNRFPQLLQRFKFYLIRITQSYTFKRSKGLIFLTHYAEEVINGLLKLKNRQEVISHGINTSFLQPPKEQKPISAYSIQRPFQFLYVSIVTVYKHQWNAAEAILKLRTEGFPVTLKLVGTSTPESLERLQEILDNDPYGCIHYDGLIPYVDLARIYQQADGFIFASSCENQPIILIEAMTAGLPIASSDRGPMPEVLEDNGFYFNPLSVDSIYSNLKEYLQNPELRLANAQAAYDRSRNYTWKDCADRTFNFLSTFTT